MKIGGISGIICATFGYYTAASLMLKPFINLSLGKPILYPKNLN
jgi:succinate-acetate transporter protein